MTLLVAFVVGFLASRLVWILTRTLLRTDPFARENHRGARVPTAGGLVIVIVVLLIEGGRALASAAGIGEQDQPPAARIAALLVVAGMGFLGLLDDLAGGGDTRGFNGHVRAFASGSLTTGAMKLLGGVAVGLVAAGVARDESPAMLAADAALIALGANLANLFDRAPGRTTKIALLAGIALVVVTAASTELVVIAMALGAAAAMLLDDLHERIMLGDTGANIVGGLLGLGAVLTLAPSSRLWVLLALAVLNLLSEFVSFSSVIAAVPPLRGLDRAGRLR